MRVYTSAPAAHSRGLEPSPEFGETLTEVYSAAGERDEWTPHKRAAARLLRALARAEGLHYRREVELCSTVLMVERTPGGLRARPFSSCRRRWCPVCAWRLSRARWAALIERLPGLLEGHGPVRWILLTLTCRNTPAEAAALRKAVRGLLSGFRRLTHRKCWPATGWLRAIEVTVSEARREYHPHLHVLVAVPPSYFKGGRYISQRGWVRLWRECLKVDYDPVVDVRRVRPMRELLGEDPRLAEALGGLREVAKYVLKPADLSRAPALAVGALEALRRVRLVDGGGWLRGALAVPRGAPEDGEQLTLDEVENVGAFWWRAVEEVYRRRPR